MDKQKKIPVHIIVAVDQTEQHIGAVADRDQSSTTWTAKGDQAFFRKRTNQVDSPGKWNLLVVGRETYDTFKDTSFITPEGLRNRRMIVLTRNPEAFECPNDLISARSIDDVHAFIGEVSEQEGLSKIFVIGGTQIYDLFLEAGVVSSIFMSVHNKVLFSGGISFVTQPELLKAFNHKHALHTYRLVTIYELKRTS